MYTLDETPNLTLSKGSNFLYVRTGNLTLLTKVPCCDPKSIKYKNTSFYFACNTACFLLTNGLSMYISQRSYNLPMRLNYFSLIWILPNKLPSFMISKLYIDIDTSSYMKALHSIPGDSSRQLRMTFYNRL